MKKTLAILLAVVMAITLFTACGDKPAPTPDTKTGSVYYLNFKPEADKAWQDLAKLYTEKTGVPVTVLTAASGTYDQVLTAEMDKDAAPTMFQVGNAGAVRTWGEYCYNLTNTDIMKEMTTDAFNLKNEAGETVSIGYCYEAFGIIVNKALLKKAGYELTDITNFRVPEEGCRRYPQPRCRAGLRCLHLRRSQRFLQLAFLRPSGQYAPVTMSSVMTA